MESFGPPTPEELAYIKAHWHEDKTASVIGINIVLIVLATTAVTLRMWARTVTKAALMIDDVLIVLALVGGLLQKGQLRCGSD